MNSLSDKVFQYGLARAAFWDDGAYSFTSKDGHLTLEPDRLPANNKWLFVVGRRHYFESVRDYPIGNLSDVKKVLKNEPWRFPYRGLLLNSVERLSDQSHRVTSWVIKQPVIDSLPNRPIWVLPETACIKHLSEGRVLTLERLGETVYISDTPDGLVSSLGQWEAFVGRVGNTDATTDYDQSGALRFVNSDAVLALLSGVKRNFKVSPFRFFMGLDRQKIHAYPWHNAVKLSLAMCLCYLLTSSIYLVIAVAWVDHHMLEKRTKSESSIVLRKEIGVYNELKEKVQRVTSEMAPLWVAWDLAIDMESRGISFRAFNSADDAVTFFLSSTSAIDELIWLTADSRVASAEFALPVRAYNDSEQYAIKVTFDPKLVVSPNSNSRMVLDEIVPYEKTPREPQSTLDGDVIEPKSPKDLRINGQAPL